MMHVRISEEPPVVFKIEFKHDHYDPAREHYREFGRDPAMIKAETVCRITGERGRSWTDSSCCSVHDNFCKETGRRIALRRTVEMLPREVRGKILHAYYARHRTFVEVEIFFGESELPTSTFSPTPYRCPTPASVLDLVRAGHGDHPVRVRLVERAR